MDWAERQEYFDLIEEEIQFTAEKGRKWLLTFEERHAFGSDVVFHVYSEKGEFMLLVYEIVDVMALDVKERLIKLNETLSGNFRILMSTLRADLPEAWAPEEYAEDGSRFKLTFTNKAAVEQYEWQVPKGNFKRIRPVLKLIWAVAGWRSGAKAMGWSAKAGKEGSGAEQRKSSEQRKGSAGADKAGRKGRLDPFGKVWGG